MKGTAPSPDTLGYTPQIQAEAIAANDILSAEREAARYDEYGLLKNEAFREMLSHAVPEAQNLGKELSLIITDFDRFKEIIDTLGHPEGDKVIDRYKSILAAMGVVAGRIGGDEFAILVPGGQEKAEEIAGEVDERFIGGYVKSPGNEKLDEQGLGISHGISTVSRDTDGASGLMRETDEKLYEKKVDNLGKLDRKQEQAVIAARTVLEQAGVRLRDVPKHWRNMDITK